MPLREIIKHPNEILRRKAARVENIDDATQQLIDDMIETMRLAPGVGLAAPQVGVSQRIVVVEYGGENDEDADESKPQAKKLYTLINPEISRASKDTEVASEGCLSIPGLVGDVERSLSVTVLGQNRHGQPIKIKASGWLARIFQHEIDHLNGVLFIDHAEKVFQLQEETDPATRA
jgi:peptide deformylase